MKRLMLLLLAVSLFLLASCGGKNEGEESMPKNTNRAGNDAVDYFFYYPDNWTVDRNDAMISIRYDASPSNTFERYASISVISFTLVDPQQVVNEYWEEYEDDLAETYSDYELLKSEETELGGVIAARKEYTGGLGGTTYNFVQVVCIRNGVVYLVTFTASREDYSKTISAMETVISNFHFE